MAALCCTILLAVKTRVFTKTGSGQTSEKLREKGRFLQGTHAWNALLVGAKRWVMFHPSTPAALLSPWAGKFKRLPPDCKAGVAGDEGEGEDDWEDLWGWYAETPLFWSLFYTKKCSFYQDRLGTSIKHRENSNTRDRFLSGMWKTCQQSKPGWQDTLPKPVVLRQSASRGVQIQITTRQSGGTAISCSARARLPLCLARGTTPC